MFSLYENFFKFIGLNFIKFYNSRLCLVLNKIFGLEVNLSFFNDIILW